MSFVGLHIISILTFRYQGDGRYNHPVYLRLAKIALCKNKGIVCIFPHRFRPMFPIPVMAIVAAMVTNLKHCHYMYVFTF